MLRLSQLSKSSWRHTSSIKTPQPQTMAHTKSSVSLHFTSTLASFLVWFSNKPGILLYRVDRVGYIWDVYIWNTLNNLCTQEPRPVIFAPHLCFNILFDCGKFEMCASFHSENIGKRFCFFQGEILISPCPFHNDYLSILSGLLNLTYIIANLTLCSKNRHIL